MHLCANGCITCANITWIYWKSMNWEDAYNRSDYFRSLKSTGGWAEDVLGQYDHYRWACTPIFTTRHLYLSRFLRRNFGKMNGSNPGRLHCRQIIAWSPREAPLNSRNQANLLSVFFAIFCQPRAKLLIEYRQWMIKDKKEETGKMRASDMVPFLGYSRSEYQRRQQSFRPFRTPPLDFLPSSCF